MQISSMISLAARPVRSVNFRARLGSARPMGRPFCADL